MNFVKIQASGNDFIAVKPEELENVGDLSDFVKKITTPKLYVGADGLISPLPDNDYAFRFFYMNYLGREVPFCGHAGRALPLFAKKMGMAEGREITYSSPIGVKTAVILEEKTYSASVGLDMGGYSIDKLEDGFIVDVGVKHFVRKVEDVDNYPLKERAFQFFERHPGIHFNVYQEMERGKIKVRTWEYDYTQEPLSCATGSISSAIAHGKEGGVKHVEVIPLSKEPLFVEIGKSVFFYGWVKMVFEGKLFLTQENA